MTIKKQVWRMNTGNEVPSDLGDRLIFTIDLLEEYFTDGVANWHRKDNWRWRIGVVGSNFFEIYAYQTTRTKSAKYERVECLACSHGQQYRSEKPPKNYSIAKCQHCNGKGYTLMELNNA